MEHLGPVGVNMNYQKIFYEALNEGMNQKKQIGMLSKENFEKALKSGKIFVTDAGKIVSIMGEFMLGGLRVRFTKAYQAYRSAFKNKTVKLISVNESNSLDVKKIVLSCFKKNKVNQGARVEGDRGVYRITIPGQKDIMILDRYETEQDLRNFIKGKLT